MPDVSILTFPILYILQSISPYFRTFAEFALPVFFTIGLITAMVDFLRAGPSTLVSSGVRLFVGMFLVFALPSIFMSIDEETNRLMEKNGVEHARAILMSSLMTATGGVWEPFAMDAEWEQAREEHSKIEEFFKKNPDKARVFLQAVRFIDAASHSTGVLGTTWEIGKFLSKGVQETVSEINETASRIREFARYLTPASLFQTLIAFINTLILVALMMVLLFFSALMQIGSYLVIYVLCPLMLPALLWRISHEIGIRPISLFAFITVNKILLAGAFYLIRVLSFYSIYTVSDAAFLDRMGYKCPKVFDSFEQVDKELSLSFKSVNKMQELMRRFDRMRVCQTEHLLEDLRQSIDRARDANTAQAVAMQVVRGANFLMARSQFYAAMVSLTTLLISLFLCIFIPRYSMMLLPLSLIHARASAVFSSLLTASVSSALVPLQTVRTVMSTGGAIAGALAGTWIGGKIGARYGERFRQFGQMVGMGMGAKVMSSGSEAPSSVVENIVRQVHPRSDG